MMTEVIEDVVLKLESRGRIYEGECRAGILTRRSEAEFEFEASKSYRSERKWLPRKVDRVNHIRLTQNKHNGDWHLLLTVHKEQAKGMKINDVLELEAAISDMLSYIRSK